MTVQRGEIYFVNLNPVQGHEQSGQRPVLVISSDAINQLPLVITVIVGTKSENVPPAGRLPGDFMKRIENAIRFCLEL